MSLSKIHHSHIPTERRNCFFCDVIFLSDFLIKKKWGRFHEFQLYKCHKELLRLKLWQWTSASQRGGGSGREQCRGNTVTWYYSRYLRLLSSSKVRSTTSAGEAHVCWGVTVVHDWVCRLLTYCVPEPCFHEETLWITPPRGWTHLQVDRKNKSWVNPITGKTEDFNYTENIFNKPITQVHETINTLLFRLCPSVFLSPLCSSLSQLTRTLSGLLNRIQISYNQITAFWIYLNLWDLCNRSK